MEIKAIGEVLREEIPEQPLTLKPLKALEPQRELYRAMLLQPPGYLEANIGRVGHVDRQGSARMCSRFLEQARRLEADLVVTPEYCVPWAVIDDIISGQLQPRIGAIWALGCESITPQQLRDLRQRIARVQGATRLIHEPLDTRQEEQKHYIDPLVYVFWGESAVGDAILCLLVQFKTVPCKDEGHIELTSLYLGRYVYKFNEGVNRISLLGIICSDAFEFTNELVDNNHRNSLILHIQLNNKPAHSDYAAYRNRLFSVGSNSDTEVLSVNWARDVSWLDKNGTYENWKNIAGSAWYLPPSKFGAADDDIDMLHRLGLYHCMVGKRWHAFYLNYAPHALLVEKQKVFNIGPQTLVQPIAPKVLERMRWNPATEAWVPEGADDGFASLISPHAALQVHLPQLCISSPLAVERALELLEGPTGNTESWFEVTELETMRVDVEESIRRVTVHQETTTSRPGVRYRRRRVQRAQTAVTLAGQGVPWPPALQDLEQGFRFRWQANDPHRNVEPLAGGSGPATLVYLDEDPVSTRIEALFAKLSKSLSGEMYRRVFGVGPGYDPRKAFEAADRARDRLCIVFKRNHRLMVHRARDYASFTQPGGTSPVDYTGGIE